MLNIALYLSAALMATAFFAGLVLFMRSRREGLSIGGLFSQDIRRSREQYLKSEKIGRLRVTEKVGVSLALVTALLFFLRSMSTL